MALTNKKQGARLDHSFSDFVDDAVTQPSTDKKPVLDEPKVDDVKESSTAKSDEKTVARQFNEVLGGTNHVIPNSIDELDSILASRNSKNGVQKTIYLDADIHQLILAKSKETGAKYSHVINLLLRKAFSEM